MKLTMGKRKGKENQNCDRGKEYLQALLNFFNFLSERSSILTNIHTKRIADKLWQWRILSDCLLCQGRNRLLRHEGVDGGSFRRAARSWHIKS